MVKKMFKKIIFISYSCNYEGGKFTLVDETKEIKDFACDDALDPFYNDENYIYYWYYLFNSFIFRSYNV